MKKIFVLLLAFSLLLAGCGSNPADTDSDTGNGDSTTSIKDLPETLENGDVKFFVWSEPSVEDIDFFTSFEEKYGGTVNYEVTTWGQMEAKILSAIAGDDAPDLIWTYDANYIKNAVNGVIAPIDDLIDLNDWLWDEMSLKMTWDGKHYLPIPKGATSEVLVYYNKTMFENNGVKTPTEYYKEGDWTYDNFQKCATALTKDTDRDGKVDQYGWASWRFFDFALGNGGALVSKNSDDKSVSVTMNSEETKYGFQFLNDAYTKHKYAKPDGNVTFETALQSGKVAMVTENSYIGTLCGKMTDEWDIVPFPTAPNNTEKKNIVTALGWGLSANAPNPEGAVAYMKMYAEYKTKSEREQLSKYFTEEQLEIIYDARKNPFDPRIDENFGVWANSQYSMTGAMISQSTDISALIAQWTPVLEQQISTTLK